MIASTPTTTKRLFRSQWWWVECEGRGNGRRRRWCGSVALETEESKREGTGGFGRSNWEETRYSDHGHRRALTLPCTEQRVSRGKFDVGLKGFGEKEHGQDDVGPRTCLSLRRKEPSRDTKSLTQGEGGRPTGTCLGS